MSFYKQWYALHTGKGFEKKVIDSLSKKGFESYKPVNRIPGISNERNRSVTASLFPSYIFVRGARTDLKQFRQIPGVLSIINWLNEPAVFWDEDVELLKRFLKEHSFVQLRKTAVNMNEMALLSNNTSTVKTDDVIYMTKEYQLILPSLGCILCAEVETKAVEVMADKMNA